MTWADTLVEAESLNESEKMLMLGRRGKKVET
jgi:hypothetical protein